MKMRILVTALLAISLLFTLAACTDPAETTASTNSAVNNEEPTVGDYVDNDEVIGEEIGGLE